MSLAALASTEGAICALALDHRDAMRDAYRRIGAEAMARTLVQRGAIGLITTHDLALAGIADELGSRAANVHFEDFVENGEIRFDYRMRSGVVRKSNAIELMRSVGLEV